MKKGISLQAQLTLNEFIKKDSMNNFIAIYIVYIKIAILKTQTTNVNSGGINNRDRLLTLSHVEFMYKNIPQGILQT
jgi:hypothetical protein